MTRTKTFRKKRPTKKFGKRRLGTSLIANDFSKPMPPSTNCILKYVAEKNNISTGSTASGSTYSLTNAFDPDVSGFGKSPLGFDEMSVFYSNYRVNKVTYKVQFHSPDVDGLKCLVLTRRKAITYSAATIERLAELSRGRVSIIATDTPLKNGLFKKTISIPMVHGITRLKHQIDDKYSSLVTTAPALGVQMDVMAQYKNNSDVHDVWVTVEILYHTTFFGLKILNQSG